MVLCSLMGVSALFFCTKGVYCWRASERPHGYLFGSRSSLNHLLNVVFHNSEKHFPELKTDLEDCIVFSLHAFGFLSY